MNVKGLGIAALGILAGCSAPDNADTQQRIALCESVMKKYIVEAKTYERDHQKLIGSCHISQKERSREQWQCVLDAMDQGTKYAEASDRCGTLSPPRK
ncbi:MAG: hypothetical protein FJ189_08610 [Gammaproteobacteria bacterium]|nr:hypothetical protein [Gammaproteobacteria bacterium]